MIMEDKQLPVQKRMLRIQDLQQRAQELGIPSGLGFSVSNVRRMIASGQFTLPCVPHGRLLLWEDKDFSDYIVNNLLTRKVKPGDIH